MVKGHINDRETVFDNPSKIEPKRPHQWLVNAAEVDLFPNKKQAVENVSERTSSGFSNENLTPWQNSPNFHSVQNHFVGRLFGSGTKSNNIPEKNTSYVSAEDSNVKSKLITNPYGGDASFGLSISHSVEDSEACTNSGGFKRVKVGQIKDSDDVQAPERHNYNRQSNGDLYQTYNGQVDTRSASIGQVFEKDGNITLMGFPYSRGDAQVRSFGAPFGKGDDVVISSGESYNKENTNIISFGGFPDEQNIISVGRPATDYEQLYNQSSVHSSTTAYEKELGASNSDIVASTPQVARAKSETVPKNKQEFKTAKKEAPNCFPSNVRSLISTGMLDGVPVKYVSVAREELRAIIKGSGYLCGCQSCNYTKVLNAYELERHAGSKTKHPNNHVYFDNGKSIYQIVQELKSTPESLLFDSIQTIFGAPINQKAFHSWKESFQAATRELRRIYGKEELNL
ncbi:uncharacterized protein LOC130740510 isoform X2 [Lotus japonicus]|nr:uncharacterized protein LOC130740510 isoform X2 [Lotus japonicus]